MEMRGCAKDKNGVLILKFGAWGKHYHAVILKKITTKKCWVRHKDRVSEGGSWAHYSEEV